MGDDPLGSGRLGMSQALSMDTMRLVLRLPELEEKPIPEREVPKTEIEALGRASKNLRRRREKR